MKRQALFLAAAVLALGCSDNARFTTRSAADFVRTGHSVSVLGVYKDGRMNPDIWEQIGPGLAAALGGSCGIGYDTLVAVNPQLSGAIDDYARANGVGDDLLGTVAPAATGDLVLVLTVAGKVGPQPPGLDDIGSMTASSPGAMSNKYRGQSMGQTNTTVMSRPRQLTDGSAFEMSASFYSVGQKKSVSLVSMHYIGPSVDDAVARLGERVKREIPGLACGGWKWEGAVDESRVRALGESH